MLAEYIGQILTQGDGGTIIIMTMLHCKFNKLFIFLKRKVDIHKMRRNWEGVGSFTAVHQEWIL